VTFAIPAHDRPALLAETLASIAAQADVAEIDVVTGRMGDGAARG
jgi:hypothetical protein